MSKIKKIPIWARIMATPFFINITLTILASAIYWYTWVFTGKSIYFFGDHTGESLIKMWFVSLCFILPALPFFFYYSED